MEYFQFIISLSLGISKNLLSKAGKKEFAGISNLMSVNIIMALVAIVIFSFQGVSFQAMLDVRFVLMASLYGICSMAAQSFYIIAVKRGPVSVCSMIYAFCFVIPTIILAIYFQEEIKVTWLVGMVLIILSLLLVLSKGEKEEKSNKKYLGFAILAMCSAGGVGLLQKFFGHFYGKDLYDEYLVLSFLFVLVFSVVGKLFFRQEKDEKQSSKKRFFVLGILLALSNVVASKLNLHLAAVLPSVFFFPTINGATILFSTIFSYIFFKERISGIGWIGILIGIGAIVMLAL